MLTRTSCTLLLLLLGIVAKCNSKSYPVTTLVNAKWGQTPLYMEISEYLAEENQNSFWDFILGLSKTDTALSDLEADSKQYLTSLNIVKNLVNPTQLPLLKLSIALHSLTPRIQAHFQIAGEILLNGDCNKSTFVTVGEELACSLEEVKSKIKERKTIDTEVETYNFDHIYPGSENNSLTVVLYGDIASKEFRQYHDFLSKAAVELDVKYICRHYLQKKPTKKVRLSGYGVELHLKSTEYKSQDDSTKQESEVKLEEDSPDIELDGFDFKILKEKFPDLTHSLERLKKSLLEKTEEIAPLKAWEFQDLGLQAAELIASIQGEEALQILQYTSQNFPTQAKTLLHQTVSDDIRKEIKHNVNVFGRSLNLQPPDAALFVNGLFTDSETLELSTLLDSLKSESRVLQSLYENGITGKAASSLLALDLSAAGGKDFAIDIRDTAIMWVNDIEADSQYRRWPSSVMDLLRPTFPGMLRNIRKNVFNLVLIVDPLDPNVRQLLKLAESFVLHLAPIRLGLVFDSRAKTDKTEEAYRAILCAYNYATQKKDGRAALSFLTDIYSSAPATDFLSYKEIKIQFKKTFDLSASSAADILGEDSDFDYGGKLSLEFIERLGFKDSPQGLVNGVPMQKSLLNPDDFEETIFTEVMSQTSTLQKSVYKGDLSDSEILIDYLMNQAHVMPRLNQRILSTENIKFIDLSGRPHKDLENVKSLSQLSNRDMTATLLHNIKYFSSRHSTEKLLNQQVEFLTIWVFADLNESKGKELLLNGLNYMKSASSVRLSFIPNTEGSLKSDDLNRVIWSVLQTLPPTEATELAVKLLKGKAPIELPASVKEFLSSSELQLKMLRVYSQRVMNLKKSEKLVVAGAKIFGPFEKNEVFTIEDFGLIDRCTTHQYADKMRAVLTKSEDEDVIITSDIIMKLTSSLVPRESKSRFTIPSDVNENYSVVKLPPKNPNEPYLDIVAVLDPASKGAQKLSPILTLLRSTINCNMKVFLCPVEQHSDMPVKNFYRFVIEPEVQFLPSGKLSDGVYAKFTGLPTKSLLTQNIQAPENWMVEAVRSVYDLDNIKLSDIGGPVHSDFELEYLLLEGHCFDSQSGAPPRGLQFTLGTKENPVVVDTIVMANLGYFQLKANPGIWELRLRQGKSADIYDVTSADGPNTIHGKNSTRVLISSLRSHVIKVKVSKKPDKINADLLSDDDENSGGIWNSITSSFVGSGDEEGETLNIFSVASGHLYERLLRIMMVSTMKHTKSPVKFWFLKNYLSPQFTDFLPQMSKEYGFKYELVQYKWPRWLHQQTEKQRIIWGYKILFFDVLFPLDVKKIIFVDADAIVRADLKELMELNLNGAPYAYTPFCDSRKEMEGFRFWKTGYWRNHLMGRRYHISALYVVDLKRFRKIAAGDRLRGQYQALSQDPNSLSNLDQDLPNNMIHQVAIKSLPDEWLWCQTWCSDSSFKKAKVIDLCNNPQTKEAKLTAAQRIVPEWKDYDAEIKALINKIEDHENTAGRDESDHEPPKKGDREVDADDDSKRHSEL